ncbi:MAG: hypothetical protein B7Z80_23485 [Rhodospirillales bacterium 20-64-7]|nr:MAG: hypothetical protein B7Z80_23485 [Rhodospirillales bacterium 20-64-7]
MSPPVAAMPMQRPMMSNAPLPEDASVRTYLQIAGAAIHGRDKVKADDALSHAETLVLTRAVPQSAGIPVDHSSRVEIIEQARAALASGDFSQAARSATSDKNLRIFQKPGHSFGNDYRRIEMAL